jgi:hypothetical protein
VKRPKPKAPARKPLPPDPQQLEAERLRVELNRRRFDVSIQLRRELRRYKDMSRHEADELASDAVMRLTYEELGSEALDIGAMVTAIHNHRNGAVRHA